MANDLVVPNQTQTTGSLNLVVENGVVKITGPSIASTTLVLAEHIMLKAGKYYFSGGNGGQSGSNFLRLGKQADDAYIVASYSDAKTEFTLSADTECKLTVYCQGSNLNQTYYPMVSLFSDIEFKHTKPNSNLTSLEAEDRKNILYTVGRTGKNIYDIKHPTRAVNMTLTDDGNGQFTQNASGAWAAWDYDFDVTVGVQYVVYIKFKSVTTYNAAGACVLKDGNGDDIRREAVNTAQTITYTFTAPTSRVRLGVTCNNSSYNQTGTFVMQDPMIVEKSIYDNFPDYQPYQGRQNYDLTVLEAEDRAALVEEIDSGAKNKYIPTAQVQAGITATVNDDNSVNVTWSAIGSSNEYCRINDNNLKLPVGNYVFSGLTESGNLNYYLHLEDSSGAILGNIMSDTPDRCLEFKVTDATKYYKVYVAVMANSAAQSTAKKIYPMICTKAAFGISKAFVPYAKSNYNLTQYTDGLKLSQNLMQSGSLNDIDKNAYVIATNAVSNRPTADSSYYFVRTSKFDNNGISQEAVSYANGNSFSRVKNSAGWQAWIQQGAAPYFASSSSTAIANFLYNAARACGINPTERTHAGLIIVSTDTIGEYVLVWFMYKHGTTGQGIQVSNNVISLTAINSSGTIALTGGTAPYNYGVMFFY